MLISEDKNYINVLKGISKDIIVNQVSSLLQGRKKIIEFWINSLKETHPNTGEKSLTIFTNDINSIIDRILGVNFN